MDWKMIKPHHMISALEVASILVEFMSYLLQTYLTNVWNLSITHAAAILNIWNGISMTLPFFLIFIVDTYLGHFRALVLSSITQAVGIAFIAMSTPPVLANYTGTCKEYEPKCIVHTHKVVFYIGLALSAVGTAGQFVSVNPLLDEQKENPQEDNPQEDNPQEYNPQEYNPLELEGLSWERIRSMIKPFICVILIPIIGGIILAKIKAAWSILFGIAAICTTVATILFLSCSFKYNKVEPKGCPYTTVCRVFVASACKILTPSPRDPNLFYTKNEERDQSLTYSRFLRWMDKAAIIRTDEISQDGQVKNRWKLCSVSEVEDSKHAVRMVPMWMTFIVCGIVSSIGNTYFIEQASNMNRKLGKWEVPLPVILMIFLWFKVSVESMDPKTYQFDRALIPFENMDEVSRMSLNIIIAMIWGTVCCITAAKIETKRLRVIRNHVLLDRPDEDIPMSVFWLYIQFFLLGAQDITLKPGVLQFFKRENPESMRKYILYQSKGIYGLGYICGVLSVYVVGEVSQIGDRKNWFQHTLNRSNLDRYYWVLAALSAANILAFILVVLRHRFKDF